MTGVQTCALPISVYYAGYDRGALMGLKGFCALVLGGLDSAVGAVAGGLLIGLLEAVGAYWASSYKDVFAFAVLLVVLYVRPRGLLGGRGCRPGQEGC